MPIGGDEIFFLRATSYPVKRASEVSNVSSFCMHASKAPAARPPCEDACRPPYGTDHACMSRIHRPLLRATATVHLHASYNQQEAVLHLMRAVTSPISSEPWNFDPTHQIKRTYVDILEGRRFGVPSYL